MLPQRQTDVGISHISMRTGMLSTVLCVSQYMWAESSDPQKEALFSKEYKTTLPSTAKLSVKRSVLKCRKTAFSKNTDEHVCSTLNLKPCGKLIVEYCWKQAQRKGGIKRKWELNENRNTDNTVQGCGFCCAY